MIANPHSTTSLGKQLDQSVKRLPFGLQVTVCPRSAALSVGLERRHVLCRSETSPMLDNRQPTLHDFSRKTTRPVREKVTIWVAGDCRPINIVEDSGLIEVIRIASRENSYDVPSRGTIVFKKKIQLNNSV